MTAMQRSFDERMGVMKNLVERDTDSVNKVAASLTALQNSLQKQQGDSTGHVEQLSGQLQSLNDTLDELRPAWRKSASSSRTCNRPNRARPRSNPSNRPSSRRWHRLRRPMCSTTTQSAINGGKNDLATQEFSDYIKFYPNTDLAGNCYFYLGEIQFRQANYQQAAQSYDQVLQNFPTGNKLRPHS